MNSPSSPRIDFGGLSNGILAGLVAVTASNHTIEAWAALVIGAIGFGFGAFSVAVAAITGPKRYNRAKLEAYECGIEPSPHAAGGGRFPVKYFLTAMLFIVFDIEIVFLYPWAVTFDKLGLFGLVEMVIFIATVFVAYAYVWRRGGLEWD